MNDKQPERMSFDGAISELNEEGTFMSASPADRNLHLKAAHKVLFEASKNAHRVVSNVLSTIELFDSEKVI